MLPRRRDLHPLSSLRVQLAQEVLIIRMKETWASRQDKFCCSTYLSCDAQFVSAVLGLTCRAGTAVLTPTTTELRRADPLQPPRRQVATSQTMHQQLPVQAGPQHLLLSAGALIRLQGQARNGPPVSQKVLLAQVLFKRQKSTYLVRPLVRPALKLSTMTRTIRTRVCWTRQRSTCQ